MDFRHLEYFVEIAKEKNITRAAEKLYVSQSAVNQYLLKLESELGTQLFTRSRRTLELTPAGSVYLRGCEKALLVRQDTYQEIHDLTDSRSGSLTIGLAHTRGLEMFTSIYVEMKKEFPDLQITPVEMSAAIQQKALAAGEIDLGFLILPDEMLDHLHYVDLGEEEIILLIPSVIPICRDDPGRESNHDISYPGIRDSHICDSRIHDSDIHDADIHNADIHDADIRDAVNKNNRNHLPVISLETVKDVPFALTRKGSAFRRQTDRIFKGSGFDPKILIETSNTSHVEQITESGQCCALVPYYYADFQNPHYKPYSLTSHPTWHLYMAYREDSYLSLAARRFIQLSAEYWKGHILKPE